MKRRGIIASLAFAVFLLMTLPSISAVQSDTLLDLKKSFSNLNSELINEQTNNMLFPNLNNRSLLLPILILLDLIVLRLIKQNYTELALLILLFELFIIKRFIF